MKDSMHIDIDKLYNDLQISNDKKQIKNTLNKGKLNNKLNSNFSLLQNKNDTTNWSNSTTPIN